VFDVALWVTWSSLFPEHTALAIASSALCVIESLMCLCGLPVVARAVAALGDGSLIYRAFGVKLSL
jgi:hypothetical protein